MKYLILLIFSILIFDFDFKPAKADNSICFYAKVTSPGTYFYNSCNNEDKLFEIPTSYFVLLTEDASQDYYCAKYGNCVGYVKKKEVVPMQGTPLKPYATNHNFRITSLSGLPLFKEATFESEEIANIEFLEDKLYYYGNFQGQEYFPDSTDVWFYCSYKKNNEINFGYVFSYYCDFITDVKQNNEYFEEITGTLSFKAGQTSSKGLSDTAKAIIVLSAIIPILIGLYFYITPKKQIKKKISTRHKDYYEINENDLN